MKPHTPASNNAIQRFTAVDIYSLIQQAAKNTRLLNITYVDSKGKVTSRVVEPYEIKEGKLYAYCQSRHGIRTFKLQSIHNAIVEPHTFTPRFPIYI